MRDLSKEKFNRLKPVKRLDGRMWLCGCDCGKTCQVRADHLTGHRVGSCGCWMRERIRQTHFTGYESLSGQYWAWIRADAERRGIAVCLDVRRAYELLVSQDFLCPYTGRQIGLGNVVNKNRDRSASLDRIESGLGYSVSNCEWVAKPLNQMKRQLSKARLIELAGLVARRTSSLVYGLTGSKAILTGTMWGRIKSGAIRRGWEIRLSREQAEHIFSCQGGTCALTGLELRLPKTVNELLSGLATASLDRIDSTVGYSVANCQWVYKDVNFMKRDLRQEEFIGLCREIDGYAGQSKLQVAGVYDVATGSEEKG